MKTSRLFYPVLASVVLCCVALWTHVSHAAGTTDPGGKSKPGATNKVDVPLPVPVSTFDVTVNPTKDPFFPNSQRKAIRSSVKEPPGVNANSFVLMALTGSATERLAMINRRTLGVGEASEITIPSGGKVKIRVLQIKEASVIIRVISPPQADLIELTLSGDKNSHIYIGADNTAVSPPPPAP